MGKLITFEYINALKTFYTKNNKFMEPTIEQLLAVLNHEDVDAKNKELANLKLKAVLEKSNNHEMAKENFVNTGEVKPTISQETHKLNWRDKLPFKDLSKEPEDKA